MDRKPDMGCLEALMKAIWGTDTRCVTDRAEADRMLEVAERKVQGLNMALDDHPPRNLDEALYSMTHRE